MTEPACKKARTEPPIQFPYELDSFQTASIAALEKGDSVLVSAHTSAGKTTVALYAIAKCLRDKKRVIFTSPIKALSNQKFREFSERFESVGLLTGDTTIKSDADCLVMTTEILRGMLYRGTELLREVGCVIFDEVHYLRDKYRGVVWEETIIMLPEGCQYVFLSATIPNGKEFAEWVEHVHKGTTCHVISTDFRPVPLQHYVYPNGADGIHLIVDEKGMFRNQNYKNAMSLIGCRFDVKDDGTIVQKGFQQNDGTAVKLRCGGKKRRKASQPVADILKLVMDRQMFPVIVFSFSKTDCERHAAALSKLDFNSADEEEMVQEVFDNALAGLNEDDRRLPSFGKMIPLLRRGIGVHHSGLLPIIKEVVELLFQAGLLKVLFSTETFSMGLNMPARTVVFTSLKKFDGEKHRYLTSGEYIQMSGRAGRRGIDRVGVVISMVEEGIDPVVLKETISGGSDTLNSAFHLTYNMVLNLMRVEDRDPEFMMKSSFAQFQRAKSRPALLAQASELEVRISSTTVEREDVFQQYVVCSNVLQQKTAILRAAVQQPRALKPFIVPGRVIKLRRTSDGAAFGWGVCRDVWKAAPLPVRLKDEDPASFTLSADVLCIKSFVEATVDGAARKEVIVLPADKNDCGSSLECIGFSFSDVELVSALRIVMPPSPDTPGGKAKLHETLQKMEKRFGENIPLLPLSEMDIVDTNLIKVEKQVALLRAQLTANEFVCNPGDPLLASQFAVFQQVAQWRAELTTIRNELDEMSKAVFSEELKRMMRVLRRLDYVDKDDLILRKARVACEITTSDESEVLLTELMFQGLFNDLETEMVVALLSCLVNVHKTPDNFKLPDEFQRPFQTLEGIVARIAKVSVECGLELCKSASTLSSAEKVLPSLMEVTYRWAKGAKFVDVLTLTTAYEGDIIRMLRRLEELLRQLANAAKSPAIGSEELHNKFNDGIAKIKRDIVFSSSLYL